MMPQKVQVYCGNTGVGYFSVSMARQYLCNRTE